MKNTILLIPAIIICFGINAQLKQKSADDYFDLEQYHKAAPIYEELSNRSIKKNDINYRNIQRTAKAYSLINEKSKAADYYAILNNQNQLTEEDLIDYIQVLKTLSRYPLASELTTRGAEKYPENAILKRWAEDQGSLTRLYNDLSSNSVSETDLNSGEGDFSPVFYGDGIIYCTQSVQKGFLVGKTGRDNSNYIRLLYAKEVAGETGKKREIEVLKDVFFSRLHNGPIAFDSTETQMFITKNIKNKEDNTAYLALFYSSKSPSGEWSEPLPFPYNSESYNVGQATFASDQKGIYFTSDQPGGFGGTDIYYSENVNGQWQEPVNLGEGVNTELDEMFPYMNQQGTLYFSSNGHFGLGGLDIFKIRLTESNPKATNLGTPINSSADDFGIIEHETRESGYFSSNRDGFVDRIYKWEGNKEFDKYYVYNLFGNVFNSDTDERIEGAEIEIKLNKLSDQKLSDQKGKYSSNLMEGLKFGDEIMLRIDVSKKGFVPQSIMVQTNLGRDEDFIYNFNLTPFDIGNDLTKVLKLDPIYYDLDKSTLREESKLELDKVANILNQNPDMIIELGSHTDCRQTYEYNMKLSGERANSAANYLRSKIVNPQNVIPIGYGEMKLVNDCGCEGDIVSDCTEEEHQENRRTEFIIVRK